ncbi:MAG: molybdate ABC transporter substrate-binding protein, partial [Rhodothalassiaceae bacterium]
MKGMVSRVLAVARRWSVVAAVAALAFVMLVPWRATATEPPLRIAAASDLQFALPEIARVFEESSGIGTRISFGSSGNLMRQIRAGAPFDVFLSADEAYAEALVEAGMAHGPGVLYAVGRLVLMLPQDSPRLLDPTHADHRA